MGKVLRGRHDLSVWTSSCGGLYLSLSSARPPRSFRLDLILWRTISVPLLCAAATTFLFGPHRGPAGLTAAIYTGRALLSTLVLERGMPGGQLNETDLVENWPGYAEAVAAPELMRQVRLQAERFGAKLVMDDVTRIDPEGRIFQVVTSRGAYAARSIILSPGSRPKELPAENVARYRGRGLSYCATCDGYFFQDKDIVQVGAGDSGLTESLFLTRFARSVSIVVRHPEDDPKAFRASAILQKRARENPKIRFLWNREVVSVDGNDHVTSVRLRNLATMEQEQFATEGVFVNIGHIPQTDFLRGFVDLDDHGYICSDHHLRTRVPGVFAAGDARVNASQYAQAIVAAGEGAMAAIEADRFLAA